MVKMTPASKEGPALFGARHLATLIALLGLVIGLFAFSGFIDILRGRVMTRSLPRSTAGFPRVFSPLSPVRLWAIGPSFHIQRNHSSITPTGCFEKTDIPNT